MKKVFFLFFAAAALTACGNNNANKTANADSSSTTASKPASRPMTAEEQRGFDLVTSSDCLGCHKIADKLQGPAYIDVAKKYAGQPGIEDTLAQHIIKGHVGTWGQIQMTPHPNLSEADAKAMVAYVLSTPNQ